MEYDINRKSLLLAIKRNELDDFLVGRGAYSFGFNHISQEILCWIMKEKICLKDYGKLCNLRIKEILKIMG